MHLYFFFRPSLQCFKTWVRVRQPSTEADYRRSGGDGRLQDLCQASCEKRDGALSEPLHTESCPASSSHPHHELKPRGHSLFRGILEETFA